MMYDAYQAQADLMAPVRFFARTTRDFLAGGWPLGDNFTTRTWGAGFELLARAGMMHVRPAFGIGLVMCDGKPVTVVEEEVGRTAFCSLLHFKKDTAASQPKVLVVAPLSGHFSTLLRGTVQTLLQDHDVYITDWFNARDIPLSAGSFDFDDYVDHVIDFLRLIGPGAHVMAVCQPAVPALVAVALMAADDDPAQPSSMTLMGGPIDTRRNPTEVNVLASTRPLEWFEDHVITTVPSRYKGASRRVYPGFIQLAGFMTMNLDRHVTAHVDLFNHLVKGDGQSALSTLTFYDEYMTVMDLPAEFYLQTVRQVFQQYLLPLGKLVSRDRKVEPAAIRRTALLTVEGEHDDICAVGQTSAAHELTTGLPAEKHKQHLQLSVGHYGVFNGRRWANEIYPVVRQWIRDND